jgi:hypothetical protein
MHPAGRCGPHDWTLPRALGTARFWWIAIGYFCGLFTWYAVQVHQTKYLIDVGFSPNTAVWALGAGSLVAVPGQIALGHLSRRAGMGMDDRQWRIRLVLHHPDPAARSPDDGAAVPYGAIPSALPP